MTVFILFFIVSNVTDYVRKKYLSWITYRQVLVSMIDYLPTYVKSTHPTLIVKRIYYL